MAKSKNQDSRWYTIQRNYKYECEHEDGKYYGLSKDEWRKKILEDWSPKKLRAKHVTIIFHDKCTVKDEHGNVTPRELHAHAVVYFEHNVTETEAMKRTGCTRLENVKIVDRKARAYRYLLHISEGAICDGKHIYGEDELIIMKLDDSVKYDYHKLIKDSEEDEDVKEEKNLLKKTIKDILKGVYDDNINRIEMPVDKTWFLMQDEKIAFLIGSSTKARREIENAIKTRITIINNKKD